MKPFEICVRGIIWRGKKVLVCKNKAKDYYFFPGGHVDFGEGAKDALARELKEELNISIKKMKFIGANENFFDDEESEHHEINLVFEVKAKNAKDKSMEDHLDFFFLDKKQLAKERVLPEAVTKQVLKWLKNKRPFYVF